MRQSLFILLCLINFSACNAVRPMQAFAPQGMASQAFLPPDAISPKPNPCNGSIHSQAFLPPNADFPHHPNPKPSANPCGCQGRNMNTQAILPPGLNQPHCP